MAGIDHRPGGREESEKGGLRPAQPEAHLVVALHDDLLQVCIPRLARALAPARFPLPGNGIPGAFDIRGCERLAVVPCHTAAQLERQRLVVRAPEPARRKVWHDRLRLAYALGGIKGDQIVEHRNKRCGYDVRALFVKRCAGRVFIVCPPQHAARLLRHGFACKGHNYDQRKRLDK